MDHALLTAAELADAAQDISDMQRAQGIDPTAVQRAASKFVATGTLPILEAPDNTPVVDTRPHSGVWDAWNEGWQHGWDEARKAYHRVFGEEQTEEAVANPRVNPQSSLDQLLEERARWLRISRIR